eukprot:TRINITY_DN1528_c0_g1_i1.p1 TRINITY_DN1528_c0_g1~~TRINITY_DN1528_c0_g1_i1.p1  ORF type:complete len:416 (-),score=78.79 TRINITY_DN1528_c0_g1_i1:132-1379(-)
MNGMIKVELLLILALFFLSNCKTYSNWVMNPFRTFYDFPDLRLENITGDFDNYPYFNKDSDGIYKLHFVYEGISYKLAGLPKCFIGLSGTTSVTPFYLDDDFSSVCDVGTVGCLGPVELYANCDPDYENPVISNQKYRVVYYSGQSSGDLLKARRQFVIKAQNIYNIRTHNYYTTVGAEVFDHSYLYIDRGTNCWNRKGYNYRMSYIYLGGYSIEQSMEEAEHVYNFRFAPGVQHVGDNYMKGLGFLYNDYHFWLVWQNDNGVLSRRHCYYYGHKDYAISKFIELLESENAKNIAVFAGDYRQVNKIDALICFDASPDGESQTVKCLTWFNVFSSEDVCNDVNFSGLWNLNDISSENIGEVSEIKDLRPFYLNGQWLLLQFKLIQGQIKWRIIEYTIDSNPLYEYLNTQTDLAQM